MKIDVCVLRRREVVKWGRRASYRLCCGRKCSCYWSTERTDTGCWRARRWPWQGAHHLEGVNTTSLLLHFPAAFLVGLDSLIIKLNCQISITTISMTINCLSNTFFIDRKLFSQSGNQLWQSNCFRRQFYADINFTVIFSIIGF